MASLEGLYRILSQSTQGNESRFVLELDPSHVVYQGHFPGYPVTPGVTLMKIVQELTEHLCGRKLEFLSASRTKFLGVVDPEKSQSIEFSLRLSDNGETVYVSAGATHAGSECFVTRVQFK